MDLQYSLRTSIILSQAGHMTCVRQHRPGVTANGPRKIVQIVGEFHARGFYFFFVLVNWGDENTTLNVLLVWLSSYLASAATPRMGWANILACCH